MCHRHSVRKDEFSSSQAVFTDRHSFKLHRNIQEFVTLCVSKKNREKMKHWVQWGEITPVNSNTHLSSPYLQSCVTCMFDGNNFTVIPLFIICLLWFSVHCVSLTQPHPQIVLEDDTLLHNLSLKMTQEYMESSARGCLPHIVFLTITAC